MRISVIQGSSSGPSRAEYEIAGRRKRITGSYRRVSLPKTELLKSEALGLSSLNPPLQPERDEKISNRQKIRKSEENTPLFILLPFIGWKPDG